MARRSMDSGEIISREGVSEMRGDRMISLTSFPLPRPWDGVGFFFANITEQERLRRKLADAEALIESLMHCAEGRIVILADERGRIERWNAAAEQLLGLDRDQLARRPLADLLSGEGEQMRLTSATGQQLGATGRVTPLGQGVVVIARLDAHPRGPNS